MQDVMELYQQEQSIDSYAVREIMLGLQCMNNS